MKRERVFAALLALLIILSATTVIFAKNLSGQETFNDVKRGDLYHGYVENLADQGIINGYGESGNYKPEKLLSREAAAKIIAEAAGFTTSAGFKSRFLDLDGASDWALKYIYALEEAGVIKGFSNTNNFGPKELITRGHMAKMLVLAFGLKKGTLDVSLTDLALAGNDGEVREAIIILASNGIVSGYGTTDEFRPTNEINRAEFAKMAAIAQATAAVQRAEADDATLENLEKANRLVGNLPDNQDVKIKGALEKRLEKLEDGGVSTLNPPIPPKIKYSLVLNGDNIHSIPSAGLISEKTVVRVSVAPAEGMKVASFFVNGEKAELLEVYWVPGT